MKSTYRIKQVISKSADSFFGSYRGCVIEIDRDEDEIRGAAFNISVTTRDGGFLYDGCWGDPEDTIDEAIEEALLGSQLIDPEQCRFGIA